jgi:hypothetical protein
MISTTSFAEYATGGRRRRTEIVTAQLMAGNVQFYRPILDAITEASSADDPAAVLAQAIDQADLTGQQRAFTEIRDGFLSWHHSTRATPIPTATSTLRVGDVDVSVTPHLGIRSSAGDQAVLFHLKEQPLHRDAAYAALRVLQICMAEVLPGGSPLVVDLRRAREFRLPHNTNLPSMDAWLTASASALTTHIRAAL